MKISPLLALLLTTFICTVAAPSVRAEPQPPRTIKVNGTAIVKTAPDEMTWSIQVSFNDANIAKAKERHDAALDAALKYLRSLGDSIKELQTGGIRFERDMYPGDSSFLKKNPYSCTTQVTFTLVDFDKYGPMADALSKIDGAQILAVGYASSKEADLRRDALKRALKDGQSKAHDLAETAGCSIDKPLSIEEEEVGDVRPEMMNYAPQSVALPGGTPAAVAGQIEFNAKVVVTYDLLPGK